MGSHYTIIDDCLCRRNHFNLVFLTESNYLKLKVMIREIIIFIKTIIAIIKHSLQRLFFIKRPDLYRFDNASCAELRKLPFQQLYEIVTNQRELISWNKIAAMIDYTFPAKEKLIYCQSDSSQSTIISEAKYCVKYAAYAYFMDFIGDPINIKIIKKDLSLFGIRPLKICKPGYFIGIDDRNKRILLCIRGTPTIGDTLTDLDAHVTNKPFGYDEQDDNESSEHCYNCHHGMYDASMSIYNDVTFKIKELSAKKEYKDYKILITGHS